MDIFESLDLYKTGFLFIEDIELLLSQYGHLNDANQVQDSV
jgi:hypothetical protein